MPLNHGLGYRKQEYKNIQERHESPQHASQGTCCWEMDRIRKRLQSWVNECGDGQFTSYHQSRYKNRDDIQGFHNEGLHYQKLRMVKVTFF